MTNRKWNQVVATLGVAAGMWSGVVSADTVDANSFQGAQAEFTRALKGDSDAVEPAMELFRVLSESDPGNPLLTAYYGSAQTLRARDAWMPWNKMKYTEEGLDTIDGALRMLEPEHDVQRTRGVPVSVETRLVAARTFLALPKFLNRGEQGRNLVADTIASPVFQTTPQAVQAQFLRLAAADTNGASAPAGKPSR